VWQLTNAVGAIKLQVAPRDFDLAQAVLAERSPAWGPTLEDRAGLAVEASDVQQPPRAGMANEDQSEPAQSVREENANRPRPGNGATTSLPLSSS